MSDAPPTDRSDASRKAGDGNAPGDTSGVREATVTRTTGETDVRIHCRLDGEGSASIETGVGFFDHMLDLVARHGAFDLEIRCEGDLEVDPHHSIEDVGITLGKAVREALAGKRHVARYGHAYVPMDDALARAVIDLSGRFYFHQEAAFDRAVLGDFPTEMTAHFWHSFAEHAGCNLHLDLLRGENAHHQVEALFKAAARALRAAVRRSGDYAAVPSTKGTLE